jgi:hypothetical protein
MTDDKSSSTPPRVAPGVAAGCGLALALYGVFLLCIIVEGPAPLLAVPLLVAGWWQWRKRLLHDNRVRESKMAVAALERLGGGDVDLGRRIAGCKDAVRDLDAEIAALQARQTTVEAAVTKLQASSFSERAGAYQRAAGLLADQVSLRAALLPRWQRVLADLEALAAANAAESVLGGLDLVGGREEVAEEQARLIAAHDELLSEGDIQRELSRVG